MYSVQRRERDSEFSPAFFQASDVFESYWNAVAAIGFVVAMLGGARQGYFVLAAQRDHLLHAEAHVGYRCEETEVHDDD